MAEISMNDLKNSTNILIDGAVYQVVYFQHARKAQGAAYVRTKLKNLKTGAVLEKTFRSEDKIIEADVERRPFQFLYKSGDTYHFMDLNNYEQWELNKDILGDAVNYLKEEQSVDAIVYNGMLLNIELPTTVDLEVVETEPGVRGDTAQGGSKPATLETGAVISVPLFINVGDVVRVDTRTNLYIERVKS
ncbi:MAG: elongation factor P [Fervidicoccus fontis]|uniref:Elongation factor P n=1 Tax=Thermodesulfobium acidiphilum TaxID=1794699 RepID=A0A2R4VYC6_THEAF|nr:elongation factor P [Thermodesulfobium acidiphilum]AWB09492.1 elongation factor P [Thermodesulfobium acidiphilum]PMB76994.1 MAG: elongation factor P [Fervidicoccus fontis]